MPFVPVPNGIRLTGEANIWRGNDLTFQLIVNVADFKEKNL